MVNSKRIIFIVGPTAVGKTEVASCLAKELNGEIISCDSMQVYKGMDIITSKPSGALRKKAPHHLIGIISPDKEYNVSRYYKEATRKVKEIRKKGKAPLIVGGTGLYMSVLLDGIFKFNGKGSAIRNRLYKEGLKRGSGYLYDKLKKIDSIAASKIHPHDTRRIVRALEVYEATGMPISVLQKQRRGLADEYEIKIFCLNTERNKLYKRVDERVEKMFAKGLAAEVKKLLKLRLSKTARFAIGIKEVAGLLDGSLSPKEAKSLMQKNTRNYAKRQLTWFRKDKRITWVEIKDREKPQEVANRIWKELK